MQRNYYNVEEVGEDGTRQMRVASTNNSLMSSRRSETSSVLRGLSAEGSTNFKLKSETARSTYWI